MFRSKIFYLFIIIIAGGLGYYYFSKTTVSTETSYEFSKIEKGDITKVVSATGTIVSKSEIILSSEISGKIIKVEKDYNDNVSIGDILAFFDQNPFQIGVKESEAAIEISEATLKQKKASLLKSKAELNNAVSTKNGAISNINDFELLVNNLKKNLIRQKLLFEKKIISVREFELNKLEYERSIFQLDNLKSVLLSAEAVIQSSQAQIQIIKAEVEEIKSLIVQRKLTFETQKIDLSKTVVISPIDGFILDRHISVGDVLGAYQKDSIMFTISEGLEKMNVEIFIYESDIGNIKVGQPIIFTTDAYPEKKINATVSQIRFSPIKEQNVITYEVVASFENLKNLLYPGMTANVDIIVDKRNDVLRIKNSAFNVKLDSPSQKEKSSNASNWSSGQDGQSNMREIIGKLGMSQEQRGKMRTIYPQLSKLRESLIAQNQPQDKVNKQVSAEFKKLLFNILTSEQQQKFKELENSNPVKTIYKYENNNLIELKVTTGLNAGGYTEIIKGDVEQGNQVITKVVVKQNKKQALRLF